MTFSLKACSHPENTLGGLTPAFLSHPASTQVRTITLYSFPYIVPPTLALTLTPELSRTREHAQTSESRLVSGVCAASFQTHCPVYSQDGHRMLLQGPMEVTLNGNFLIHPP